MQLHSAPNTCALASHIALEEAGGVYQLVRVDFAANQQRTAAYLAINPKGRVPALVTEQGVLTETPAILVHIAQTLTNGELALMHSPFDFAQVQSFNSYLCSTVHVAHAHRPRGYRWADEPSAWAAMKNKVPENMATCFQLIEETLLRGPWVMGADYTVCDPYLFTLTRWLEGDGVEVARFPQVADHQRRMMERPAVRRALEQQ